MKILPFVLKRSSSSLSITSLSLFLSQAGKGLWQTDEPTLSKEQLETDYLLPNGILATKIWIQGSIAYVQVNAEKTRFQDFYTWEEALQIPSRPECWRTYWFFVDDKTVEWFTSRYLQGESELEGKPIHEYYEELFPLLEEPV